MRLICLLIATCIMTSSCGRTRVEYVKAINEKTAQITMAVNKAGNLKSILEIELIDYKWLNLSGRTYLQTSVQLRNLGPYATQIDGELNFFDILDSDRTAGKYKAVALDSRVWRQEAILANGKSDQCLTFDGDFTKGVSLVYAPYNLQTFDEGRYISFGIKK